MCSNLNFVSEDVAVSLIRSGSHIHLSSIASVPHILIDALKKRADAGEVKDLHFHHFHTEGPALTVSRNMLRLSLIRASL